MIKFQAKKCKYCGYIFDSEIVDLQIESLKEKEREKLKAGYKKCPTCGNWDVHKAYVEDGSFGDWCPHCKKSIKSFSLEDVELDASGVPKYVKIKIDSKTCLLCGEQIKLEALKCKYCGNLFDPNEVAKQIEGLKSTREKIRAGYKNCATCGNWDVYKAYVEDGSLGYWCPHCKKSVKGISLIDVEIDFVDELPDNTMFEMKTCPTCAEPIRREAIKCKYCGHMFDPHEVDIQAEAMKEREKLKAGYKKCPTCGNCDVHKAYVEDGSFGDWCPHCKKSIDR